MLEKSNLAGLSLKELHFKKIEYKNAVLGPGLSLLLISLTTIVLSIIATNFLLIALAIIGLNPFAQHLIRLNEVHQEIKSRDAG